MIQTFRRERKKKTTLHAQVAQLQKRSKRKSKKKERKKASRENSSI